MRLTQFDRDPRVKEINEQLRRTTDPDKRAELLARRDQLAQDWHDLQEADRYEVTEYL